jgi:hemerythrin
MTVFWSDEKHSVGYDAIDNQHKELFLITNRLAEAEASPDSPERTRIIIANMKRLLAYCHFHFTTEEELLKANGYEELLDHCNRHRMFTGRIKFFLEEIRQKSNPRLKAILDELVDWIIFHIQGEDRSYANWFKAQGKPVELHGAHSGGASTSTSDSALRLWTDHKLELKLKGIDEQHRELVMILAQANDLLRATPERQRLFLPGIIQKMYYYSQFHFSFEEELMSQKLWPGLAHHRELHAVFIDRIIAFTTDYKTRRPGLVPEIVDFLRVWTINHILEEDRAFKDFLKG